MNDISNLILNLCRKIETNKIINVYIKLYLKKIQLTSNVILIYYIAPFINTYTPSSIYK